MNDLSISNTVSIKEAGFTEEWLQTLIWENPNCLGLGELESITQETAVSSGGRLDILLKNSDTDAMYEVEVNENVNIFPEIARLNNNWWKD